MNVFLVMLVDFQRIKLANLDDDEIKRLRATLVDRGASATDYQRNLTPRLRGSLQFDALEHPFAFVGADLAALIHDFHLCERVAEVMGWPGSAVILARWFFIPHRYRGVWHVDAIEDKKAFGSCVQATVSLAGTTFQIASDISASNAIGREIARIPIYRGTLADYVDVEFPKEQNTIKLKPGEVIVFNPELYHRGVSDGERFDLHLRFVPRYSGDSKFTMEPALNLWLLQKNVENLGVRTWNPSQSEFNVAIPQASARFTTRLLSTIVQSSRLLHLFMWLFGNILLYTRKTSARFASPFRRC